MSKNKAISSYLEDYYWYWFCNIPRIGKTKLRQLLMVFESPEHVYKADVEVLRGLGSLSDKELMYISDSKKDKMQNKKNLKRTIYQYQKERNTFYVSRKGRLPTKAVTYI